MLFMASTRDADRRFAEQYPCPAIWAAGRCDPAFDAAH
jgi:hypothetical protein